MRKPDDANGRVDRRRVLQAMGAAGAAALAGCAGDEGGESGNGGTDDNGVDPDIDDDVTAWIEGMGARPSTIDMHEATRVPEGMVLNSIHDTMFVHNMDLEPEPYLAESVERNDDATEFTLTLRDDVTFHDGNELNAERAAWSYNRLLDISPQRWRLGPVDSIEETGDYDLTFHFEDPYPLLPNYLCHHYLGVVSPEAVQEHGDEYGQDVAVGTGPLQFERWDRDEAVVLTPFEEYDWGPEFGSNQGPAGGYDEFHFRNIPEASTLYNELTVGNVHGTHYLGTGDVSEAADHDNTSVERVEDPHPNYLVCNVRKAPTDEVDVRRAIGHAINRDAVINAALNGEGYPIWSPSPPLADGGLSEEEARERGQEYDPDRARQLLEDAGWTNDGEGEPRERDGETLEINLFAFTINRYQNVGEVVEALLTAVGFDVDFQVLEAGTLYDRAEGSEHNVMTMSYSDAKLAVNNLDATLHSSNDAREGGSNFSLWDNQEFDDYIHEAKSNPDSGARRDAMQNAQRVVLDQVPVVPVAGYTKFYGYKNDVDLGVWLDHDWWVDQHYLHRLEAGI